MPRLVPLLLAASVLSAAPEPYKPSEGGSVALPRFQVPEGLEVTLWARSPMLANPTNLDIDAQGRVWVTEGVNYRVYNKGGKRRPEGDRVVVLSDTKGAGQADTVATFAQDAGWTSPLGIAVFDNVVIVSHAPDLIKFTDVNRDGKFDPAVDKREVLLGGFGGQDHDHSLHAIVAGPDGKLYLNSGNCGAAFTDKSGKTFRVSSGYVDQRGGAWPYDPKTTAGAKSDDGFVWSSGFSARMNADGSGAEIIGNGYRNSYEHFPSSFGDLFQGDNDDSSSCRTSFILEYGTAGYTTPKAAGYGSVRRPGQPTPRAHWRQDDPDTMDVGDVYGSGSPTGITVYENGALGDAWNGTLLNCEPSRNTIFAYKLQPRKGSFALNESTRKDFITSNPTREFEGTDFHRIKTPGKSGEHIWFRPSDVAGARNAFDLGSQMEVHAHLAEYALHLLADGAVHRGEDGIRELHHRHLGAQALVDAAELQANYAAADDDQALGHLGEAQGLGRTDDALAVKLGEGQLDGGRPGGHDEVLSLHRLLLGARNLHGVGIDEGPQSLEDRNLVLVHQKIDARAGRVDHLLLAGHHLGPVDLGGLDVDAVLRKGMGGVVVMLRRVQQRLRRDATHVEAGSAEGGVFFNQGRVQTQLGAANGAHVASGAGADNQYVVFHTAKVGLTGVRGAQKGRICAGFRSS